MILAVVLIVWRAKLFTMESTRIFETAPLREKNREDRKDSVDLELSDTRLSVHSSSNSVLSRNSTFLGNADKYQHPR